MLYWVLGVEEERFLKSQKYFFPLLVCALAELFSTLQEW